MRGLVAVGSVVVALVAALVNGWLGFAAVIAGAALEESIRYARDRRKKRYDTPASEPLPPWAYTRTGMRPEGTGPGPYAEGETFGDCLRKVEQEIRQEPRA